MALFEMTGDELRALEVTTFRDAAVREREDLRVSYTEACGSKGPQSRERRADLTELRGTFVFQLRRNRYG